MLADQRLADFTYSFFFGSIWFCLANGIVTHLLYPALLLAPGSLQALAEAALEKSRISKRMVRKSLIQGSNNTF